MNRSEPLLDSGALWTFACVSFDMFLQLFHGALYNTSVRLCSDNVFVAMDFDRKSAEA